MSDKKQLTLMSQFSIIRETPVVYGNHPTITTIATKHNHQTTSTELKFKIEPIGIQPEDDDDLETCPSRTRSSWPHQIIPWWKPTDQYEKPPYSYATLIAHAILTSKDGRLTLSDIYKWISEAYPYYKRGQKGWQNSIRHNLSLNKKWFIKVDRRPTQAHPGKGGYWTLQMNMEKIFVENLSQAGGHSRRHHDMGMYATTQYYPSAGSSEECQDVEQHPPQQLNICPNIHITVPEDYQAGIVNKKSKVSSSSAVTAPRIRNMTSQEKETESMTTLPKTTDLLKNFIIRFNPEPSTSNNKRKSRPTPKSGKRRHPVEPGSSTAEEDDDQDSAVDVESLDYDSPPISKKRKATIATDTVPTAESTAATIWTSTYPSSNHANTRPSDLIDLATSQEGLFNGFNDFWMYDEEAPPAPHLLPTSEYPLLYDMEAQNILDGLTAPPQHPDMKTIDLQSMSEKNIHYPTTMMYQDLNNMFNSDMTCYNMEQYVDFGAAADDHQRPPSDILLQQDEMMLNTFWPTDDVACFMNFNAAAATTHDIISSSMP